MSKIISVHAFRGSTGKTTILANLASLLASRGMRIGVIDTNFHTPAIHALFGLQDEDMPVTLNDYLWGREPLAKAVVDVTDRLQSYGSGHDWFVPVEGRLFVLPASMNAREIAAILREGYDVGLLNDGFHAFIEELNLDILMIDTHSGLREETLLSIAISDSVLMCLRIDAMDFQGTAVAVEVARKLDVPVLALLANMAPPQFNPEQVRHKFEKTFEAQVGGVLPFIESLYFGTYGHPFPVFDPEYRWLPILSSTADILLAG